MTQVKALRALGALLVFAFVPTAALCAEVETQPAANAQPAASSARPSLSDNPTLQEYLDYAAANNPGLLAARYRHLAAAERPAQETSLSDPQLTYKYALQSDTEQQSVTVEQMLPWPGKLSLRGQAAQDMSRAEFHRYKAAALETAFGVKEAYYEYYYLGRAIAVTASECRKSQCNDSAWPHANHEPSAGTRTPGCRRGNAELACSNCCTGERSRQ